MPYGEFCHVASVLCNATPNMCTTMYVDYGRGEPCSLLYGHRSLSSHYRSFTLCMSMIKEEFRTRQNVKEVADKKFITGYKWKANKIKLNQLGVVSSSTGHVKRKNNTNQFGNVMECNHFCGLSESARENGSKLFCFTIRWNNMPNRKFTPQVCSQFIWSPLHEYPQITAGALFIMLSIQLLFFSWPRDSFLASISDGNACMLCSSLWVLTTSKVIWVMQIQIFLFQHLTKIIFRSE